MKKLNKKGSTVNGAISRRDEYIVFSIIVTFKIKPNQFTSVSCPFLPLFSKFHVLCFKFWLLYASYLAWVISQMHKIENPEESKVWDCGKAVKR